MSGEYFPSQTPTLESIMKTMIGRLCLIVSIASLALLGSATPAFAQDRGGADRLERLEKRVNEMAERQEQFMRRLGAQMERQGDRQGDRQNQAGRPERERLRAQLPPPGAPGAPFAPQNPQAAKAAKGLHDLIGLLCLIGFICNILLAVWIYTDIRKRGEGSGIFIAMALVAGIPAALIYALTRIGEKKA